MKKASVLIIVSVLLVALLCLAGCGSSSSGEDTSSSTATTENSDSESNGDDASDDSSSSGSESSASESNDNDSADKSTTKKYTDKEIGLTVSLPSEWTALSEEDREELGYAGDTFLYLYYDKRTSGEYIWGQKFSDYDYDGVKITDFSKDYVTDFYSDTMSVDSVKKKKLDSGTYYQIKGKGLDDDNYYYVAYDIIKNGYDIRYEYASYGGNSDHTPHLDDFENMVNSAKYK